MAQRVLSPVHCAVVGLALVSLALGTAVILLGW